MRERKQVSGYKLEVFFRDRTEEHLIHSALDAKRAAQSWFSRGLEVKVTDLRNGKIVYGHEIAKAT